MSREVIEIVGRWTEDKIRAVEMYAKAYAVIFAAEAQRYLHPIYIDAFSGSGLKESKETGNKIEGSPLRVLSIEPRFQEYHFIDADPERIAILKNEVRKYESQIGQKLPVEFYVNEANQLLQEKLLPAVRYEDYRRALLFLDPYGLNVQWSVMELAGRMQTIDVILNFSIQALNRNFFPPTRRGLTQKQKAKLDVIWGNGWEDDLYAPSPQEDLFLEEEHEKIPYGEVVNKFGERLVARAGFSFSSNPMLFKADRNQPLYYLLLASNNPTAKKIMDGIVTRVRQEKD